MSTQSRQPEQQVRVIHWLQNIQLKIPMIQDNSIIKFISKKSKQIKYNLNSEQNLKR
jgi:hypothetical protein